MPRIRTIKPEFWSHPVMGRQPDPVKTMAVALLNWADDHGYFYADPELIRSFARPFDDDSRTTLGCLQQLMKIDYIQVRLHEKRGYIGRIVSFEEHQRVDKPKPSKIKDFFDSAIPVISLGLIQDESKIVPAGKEGKGKDINLRSKAKPSPASPERKSAETDSAEVLPQDSKHTRLQAMIMNAYKDQNGVDCPWDGGEGRNLSDLIKSTPRWPDTSYAQCLANMYASQGFPKGSRPREFLTRLPKYLNGPLNEFNREETNGNRASKAERRNADISETTRRVFDPARVLSGYAAKGLQNQDAGRRNALVAGHVGESGERILDAGDRESLAKPNAQSAKAGT